MTEIDKTYNSVVLGALLHDIGKFLHRGEGKYKGEHEEASYKFITAHRDKLTNDQLYDIDLISFLAKFHGSTRSEILTDQYFVGKADDEKEKLWRLVSIVIDADCYSCVERDLKQPRRKGIAPKKAPLDSIFSNINLGAQTFEEKNKWRYPAQVLNPLTCFPLSLKTFDMKEYEKYIEDFENNIPDFSKFEFFVDVLNVWLSLLERYTWAIPSDTRYEFSDVSLYDHLRSSSAIASCLYKRHIEDINAGKNLKRKYEFVLIGGDFSGIQKYIFDITNRGSGGASKRLRARSFFVTLLSEVTVHKILDMLELPLVCNIFSAGGKFLLLVPNLDGIKEKLQGVKNEIEKEIHEGYFTQFSFLMAWKDIKVYRDEFKVFNFFKIADKMFHMLESEKLRKAKEPLIVQKSGQWNLDAFKALEIFKSYKGNADCRICGKGPALYKDDETGQALSCAVCHRDKFTIGQELPKINFVAFGRGDFDAENLNGKIVIFRPGINDRGETIKGYYVELLKEQPIDHDYYLVYDIGGDGKYSEGGFPIIKKYYANYVPADKDGILDFGRIAEKSIWTKEENNVRKSYGSDLLGVLKADIDNLGLIFSKGFTKPRHDEEKLDEEDRKTVSRFLTMSRMIDLFFSGWMKDIMSNKRKEEIIDELKLLDNIDKEQFGKYLKCDYIDFKNIYTVYSGGDDLVFVGPWETMIVFSIYLNQQFRRYTCQNRHITLSAGLTFVKEKHPIASAIKQADELLEKSKKEGKNRITLFGTTVEWEKLSELINLFLFFNKEMQKDDDTGINTAFLHRLFTYHRMALRYLDEGQIEGLKYISALSYDIGRNIVEWDKNGRITSGEEAYDFLQCLINEKPCKDSSTYNLKIPLFWTLYRNR